MPWPDVYEFGNPVAQPHTWFAWKPVRTWDRRWVWFKTVRRCLIAKHDYLHGPDWEFWSYAYPPTQEKDDE